MAIEINNEMLADIKSYIDKKYVPSSARTGGAGEADGGETFSHMLLRIIEQKGLKDSEVYKKANVDRKMFSRIRNDESYRPKKKTVFSLAIALELPLEETQALLARAGYELSDSDKGDIIIEYFVSRGRYNVFEINEALFEFRQSLLNI